MRPGFTNSLLLAGLVLLPLKAAAGEGCLLAGDDDVAALPEGAVHAYLGPDSARAPGTIEIECLDGRVATIHVILPAGSKRELLLVGRLPVLATEAELGMGADWASLAVEPNRVGNMDRLLLSFQAPDDADEGEVLTGHLTLPAPPLRSGEATFTIPLQLTVRGEAPLFRDKFDEIDPVIGQFSQVM